MSSEKDPPSHAPSETSIHSPTLDDDPPAIDLLNDKPLPSEEMSEGDSPRVFSDHSPTMMRSRRSTMDSTTDNHSAVAEVHAKINALKLPLFSPRDDPSSFNSTLTPDNLRLLSQTASSTIRRGRKRAASSVTSRREVARLVRDIDSNKASTQAEFEDWKGGKWGEKDLDGVDFDPEDFDLEVLGDVIMPTGHEFFHQVRQTLRDGVRGVTRLGSMIQDLSLRSVIRNYLNVGWNRGVEGFHGVRESIGDRGQDGDITIPVLTLFVIEVTMSLVNLILTFSGLKLLMSIFDRPLLLKTSYLPSVYFPKARFKE